MTILLKLCKNTIAIVLKLQGSYVIIVKMGKKEYKGVFDIVDLKRKLMYFIGFLVLVVASAFFVAPTEYISIENSKVENLNNNYNQSQIVRLSNGSEDQDSFDISYHLYDIIPNDPVDFNPSILTYTEEDEFTLEIPSDRLSAKFAGWYLSPDFSGSVVEKIELGSTGDISLYAKWQTNKYTVTFIYEDEIIKTEEVEHSQSIEELPIVSKEGYEFLGWRTINDVDFISSTTVNKDVVVYAVFVKLNKITFKVDNVIYKEIAVWHLMKINENKLPEIPAKEGHEFLSWHFGVEEFNFNSIITNDIELNATFKIKKYTVTFKDDTGELLSSQNVEYGKTVSKPDDLKKEGYEFLGWYVGEVRFDFASAITKDIELKAVFQEIETEKIPPALWWTFGSLGFVVILEAAFLVLKKLSSSRRRMNSFAFPALTILAFTTMYVFIVILAIAAVTLGVLIILSFKKDKDNQKEVINLSEIERQEPMKPKSEQKTIDDIYAEIDELETEESEDEELEDDLEEEVFEEEDTDEDPEELDEEDDEEESEDVDENIEKDTQKESLVIQPDSETSKAIKKKPVYNYSFQSRLHLADEEACDYYSTLKNHLLSYKGIKSNKSWKQELFSIKAKSLVKVRFHGKTMRLYFSEDLKDKLEEKYGIKDVSNVATHKTTPYFLIIKGPKIFEYAIELVDLLMELQSISKKDNYRNKNYCVKKLKRSKLIDMGLVKVNGVAVKPVVQKKKIYNYSFQARLHLADKESCEYYSKLKNHLLSFDDVTSNISWKQELFSTKGKSILKIRFHGNSMRIYFGEELKGKIEEKFGMKDVSNVASHKTTPLLLIIKGPRIFEYALELVDIWMNLESVDKNEKYEELDLRVKKIKRDELINMELIKISESTF